MWTLSMTPGGWVSAAVVILFAGKLLQQGGRAYAEGKPWMLDTFVGVMAQFSVIIGSALLLAMQNSQ